MLAGETLRPTAASALGISAEAQRITRLNRSEIFFMIVIFDYSRAHHPRSPDRGSGCRQVCHFLSATSGARESGPPTVRRLVTKLVFPCCFDFRIVPRMHRIVPRTHRIVPWTHLRQYLGSAMVIPLSYGRECI